MITRAMGYALIRSAILLKRSLSVPNVADDNDALRGLPAKRALVVWREVRRRANSTDAVEMIATRQERACQRYCYQRLTDAVRRLPTHDIENELDDARVDLHVAHEAVAPWCRVLAEVVQRCRNERRPEAHDERADYIPPLQPAMSRIDMDDDDEHEIDGDAGTQPIRPASEQRRPPTCYPRVHRGHHEVHHPATQLIWHAFGLEISDNATRGERRESKGRAQTHISGIYPDVHDVVDDLDRHRPAQESERYAIHAMSGVRPCMQIPCRTEDEEGAEYR